jgi:hypothetical protein
VRGCPPELRARFHPRNLASCAACCSLLVPAARTCCLLLLPSVIVHHVPDAGAACPLLALCLPSPASHNIQQETSFASCDGIVSHRAWCSPSINNQRPTVTSRAAGITVPQTTGHMCLHYCCCFRFFVFSACPAFLAALGARFLAFFPLSAEPRRGLC